MYYIQERFGRLVYKINGENFQKKRPDKLLIPKAVRSSGLQGLCNFHFQCKPLAGLAFVVRIFIAYEDVLMYR